MEKRRAGKDPRTPFFYPATAAFLCHKIKNRHSGEGRNP
jgi:hypothetical protein